MAEEESGVPIPPKKAGNGEGATQKLGEETTEEAPHFEQPLQKQLKNSKRLHLSLRDVYGEHGVQLPNTIEGGGLNVEIPNSSKMINPFSSEEVDIEKAELTEKLQEFYSKYNKDKLKAGVGHYVIFVERFGLNALNRRLMKQYGADLNMSIEDQEQLAVDFERKMSKKQKHNKEILKVKQALIKYLKKHDKDRIVVVLPVLLQYARERGGNELSRFVAERYGAELPGYPATPKAAVLTHQVDVEMLIRYYKKHNPKFLKDADKRKDRRSANLEGVLQWVRLNGVARLDKELSDKYHETFTDFSDKTSRLQEDVEKFRDTVVGEGKTIEAANTIVDWAIVHGRQALNYELYKRYGRHLDSAKVQQLEEEAMRAMSTNDPNRVSF